MVSGFARKAVGLSVLTIGVGIAGCGASGGSSTRTSTSSHSPPSRSANATKTASSRRKLHEVAAAALFVVFTGVRVRVYLPPGKFACADELQIPIAAHSDSAARTRIQRPARPRIRDECFSRPPSTVLDAVPEDGRSCNQHYSVYVPKWAWHDSACSPARVSPPSHSSWRLVAPTAPATSSRLARIRTGCQERSTQHKIDLWPSFPPPAHSQLVEDDDAAVESERTGEDQPCTRARTGRALQLGAAPCMPAIPVSLALGRVCDARGYAVPVGP